MDNKGTEILKKLAIVYLVRACSGKFRAEYNASVEIALHFAEEVGGEFYKDVREAIDNSDIKHTERILELTERMRPNIFPEEAERAKTEINRADEDV